MCPSLIIKVHTLAFQHTDVPFFFCRSCYLKIEQTFRFLDQNGLDPDKLMSAFVSEWRD